MFTGLLFYAYVGIHQVRILLFDNYQRFSVAFKSEVTRDTPLSLPSLSILALCGCFNSPFCFYNLIIQPELPTVMPYGLEVLSQSVDRTAVLCQKKKKILFPF